MLELIKMVLQNLMFSFLHLGNSGSFPKPLSAAKERELLEKMNKENDKEARNQLIEHNLRLVAHIIKKYYSEQGDQDDLISIGTIGLIKAIDSFKPDKGTRLATYAARCIENEILMFFRSQKKNAGVMSINEPIDFDSEGNPLTLIDIIYTDDTIADDIDKANKTRSLYKYIDGIKDEREKEIIIRRYGLFGNRELTQREIAKQMGISRSYVSRIEKKVVENLREKFGVK
ncbi:MAG: RNA polymerase sporulation sigma factor SigK [Faecalibacterium sp.]|nr:RNA polymerase sporulation sigma factor SigK [Ruminococcus sp.]MCM1392085.1 RNA polymerase sporulation sigma factor SigK [Ruminococcus sp.]MCM1486690.1 RNA polymerase sporulation sigma factor SigK [Faecalibacterium sp.]